MNDDERSCAIALATCPALEPGTLRRLLAGLGTATAVWTAPADAWRNACAIRADTMQQLDAWRRAMSPDCHEARLRAQDIRCIARDDENYPASIRDLTDPPLVLFVKGHAEPPVERSIAVVGTRRASGYGLEATRWISDTLVRNGIAIVSGLALGIDGAAHEAALRAGGTTLAVLASGVDLCYPPSHRRLYDDICRTGAVFSEYAPGTPVAKHRFPERNRLLAALAQTVIVIQAGDRSGALRTVDAALEIGRDVYVVPGPITSVHFRGSHRLLKDGAQILVDPLDCLGDLRLAVPAHSSDSVPERWRTLYDSLLEDCAAATLAAHLAAPLSHVYAGLLQLELGGYVERRPGGMYRRIPATR